MNLTGQRVTHILPSGKPGKYGTGTIVDSQNGKSVEQICVKFDSEDIIKSFSYPECFGRYLVLNNPKYAKQIEIIQEACTLVREKCQKKESAEKTTRKPAETTNKILKELDNMVGLDGVKHDVHMLTSFIRVNNMRRERGLKAPIISKHLVLAGNPGTGKTTVARMIARIYYSIGAIKQNKIVETNRAGLVAGYIGQTAIKTQEKINKAIGGVLFIDEAYTLASDSNNDYGTEAIDTLLSAMENHRDDLVVIVAGYEGRMKKFINTNPGLASRFNRYIHFEDYNPNDMMSIFLSLCEENEYVLQEEAEEHMKHYLQEVYGLRDEEFGNARFVRNLFERVIAYQAERIISLNEVDDDALIGLTLSDVENAIHAVASQGGSI